VELYQVLKKETWEERNCATPERNIIHLFRNSSIRNTALKWLVENEILIDTRSGLVLSEINQWEECLKMSLELILEKNVSLDEFDPSSVLLTSSGKRLCDEQKCAFEVIATKPILLVDGRAGSGKVSSFLIFFLFP
jgi:hypothetical protein